MNTTTHVTFAIVQSRAKLQGRTREIHCIIVNVSGRTHMDTDLGHKAIFSEIFD